MTIDARPTNALSSTSVRPNHQYLAHTPPTQNRIQEPSAQYDLYGKLDNYDVISASDEHDKPEGHIRIIKNSLPIPMEFKSDEMRLLIFPTTFLPFFSSSAGFGFSSRPTTFVLPASCATAFCLPFPTEDGLSLPLLPPVSAPALWSCTVALDSATDAVSGVPASVVSPLCAESSVTSAFMRILSACSNTSCVMIASIRVSSRVCEQASVSQAIRTRKETGRTERNMYTEPKM